MSLHLVNGGHAGATLLLVHLTILGVHDNGSLRLVTGVVVTSSCHMQPRLNASLLS